MKTFFHLHLISDSTGETLTTVARAATAMEASIQSIEHLYPMVRSDRQLDRAFADIGDAPGIIMYTLVNQDHSKRVERFSRELGVPCVSVLEPVVATIKQYLNINFQRKMGGQHVLDSEYFQRIDALNFTMAHDDGLHADDLDIADVILLGISRTSKTPTSVYLANRSVRTANIPLVPNVPIPKQLEHLKGPLIVCLIASAERIVQIRENRMAFLNPDAQNSDYVDRRSVADEIAHSRRLCAKHSWPMIDVTRRSIEETAAEILALLRQHRQKQAESNEAYTGSSSTTRPQTTGWQHRR